MGLFGPSRTTFRQRAERYPTIGIACPLGQVRDLSATGMRVRSESKPDIKRGESRQFTVGNDSQRLRVTGRAVWVRRVSLRAFEIGIQFIGVTPASSVALVQLGRYGFVGAGGGSAGGTGSETGKVDAAAKSSSQAGSGAGAQRAGTPLHAAIEVEDLYAALGVSREASAAEIRAAYRTLVMRFHPDVAREEGSEERFAAISKAYSVLRDQSKRERYDKMLDQALRAA